MSYKYAFAAGKAVSKGIVTSVEEVREVFEHYLAAGATAGVVLDVPRVGVFQRVGTFGPEKEWAPLERSLKGEPESRPGVVGAMSSAWLLGIPVVLLAVLGRRR